MVAPFDQVFGSLQQDLERLEETRVRLYGKYKTGLIAMVGTIVAALATAIPMGISGWIIAAVIIGALGIFGPLLVFAFTINPVWDEYRRLFKGAFIRPIVASAGENVAYFPEQSVTIEEYNYSGLYSTGVDRWTGEDLITGRVGKTDIRMSELHTEYKTETTDKDGKTQTSWHTIFRGLFISADFHKQFAGVTYVQTDRAERAFGSLGRMFQRPMFSGLQLIELEDVAFEKSFAVTASDQVEARYILSPAMMQRMLALKERFQSETQFSFVGTRMFIAIPTAENLFEPKFGQSVLDRTYLQTYHQQVAACVGVVEDMGLNVRVWTKN